MQNLLDFLARHFHWLVFLLLETVSGILLFSYNSYQGSTWISTANAVTGKTLELQADVEQFFSLKRLNEELSLRNVVLEQRVRMLSEGAPSAAATTPGASAPGPSSALPSATTPGASAPGLPASTAAATIPGASAPGPSASAATTPGASAPGLLPAALPSGGTLIRAKVVSNTIDRRDNLITIDRGRADGVHEDMGVISGTGIVGVVYMAAEHYSIVLPALNSRSRISCSIRGRNYFGYLTWPGGSPVEAYVEDIPRHARFKKGEWVETSGYSAIFPKGVAVGKIVAIYNSRDGLSYSLKVHLCTDFACLRDVFVINDPTLPEQRRLMESARDSLEIK